jgi:hypothetical protein
VSWAGPFRDDRMTVRGGDVLTALLASFVAYTLYQPIPTENRSGHQDPSTSPALPMPFRSSVPVRSPFPTSRKGRPSKEIKDKLSSPIHRTLDRSIAF